MANMNMKNVESFDIELTTPSGIFYGGQQVAGKAVLVVESDLELTEILLTFQGYASTDWREMRGTGDNREWKRYYGKETYFDFCESLVPKGQEPLILRPGRYEYPFSFDLPSDIPTSFESGTGHIRYRLQATIDRPSTIFDTSATCLISVLKPLDLNTNPDATNMSEYEDSKTLCCLCCETGPITGKLRVDRMGHVCGEAIIPKGEVINKSSRDIRLLTLKLIQECTYKANNPYTRTKRTYKTLVQIQLGRLEEKKNMQLGGTKLIVPPAPPSGLDGCEIIGMHYFVNLIVSPSGMGFDLVLGVPVIIGTIPLESTVEQYGVPPPIQQSTLVTPSGHGPEPPAIVLPSNIPAPSYAQSNFGSIFDEEDQQARQKSETSANAVGPAQEENTWTPSYSYYNWN